MHSASVQKTTNVSYDQMVLPSLRETRGRQHRLGKQFDNTEITITCLHIVGVNINHVSTRSPKIHVVEILNDPLN